MPVDHSGKVGWEGQLSQLANLLETDPAAGMQSLRGFMLPDDRNPEFPDPFPTESEVIARVEASKTLAQQGAMGHHGADDYTTCMEPKHWEYVPARRELTEQQREDLAAEIEMDML